MVTSKPRRKINMSKNMTRKGLALGASAALVAAGFSGIPAHAAETLSLAPSAGTAYSALTTSSFKLAAGFAGSESTAAQGTLKYRITNAGGATLAFDSVTEAGVNDSTPFDYVTGTASTDAAATAADIIVYGDGTPAIGSASDITVSTSTHSANVVITVQAFLDLDGGNDIDAGEATSPVRTITFYDQANVTGTVSFASLVLGSAAVKVNVTLSPEMNYQQLDSDDVTVQLLDDTADSGTAAAAAWNTTLGLFQTSQNLGAVANTASIYGAQLEVNNGATKTDTGSIAYSSVAAGQVASLDTVDNDPSASVSSTDAIRSGAGSFDVYTTVTPVGTSSAAGQTVTFTISETGNSTLDSGAVITVGGKTLKNASTTTTEDLEVTAVSDADGVALVTVSYTGIKATNAFSVAASAEAAAGASTGGAADTFTAEDSLAYALVDDKTGQYRVTKGSAMSIGYTVVDQFGQTPVGTFRVEVAEDGSTPVYTGVVGISAGKGTFSVTENSTANSDYTVTGTLKKLSTLGAWEAISPAVTETTKVSAVTADSAVAVSATAGDDGSTTALTRALVDAWTGDAEITVDSVAVPTYAGGTTVSGSVTGTGGAPLKGALVTLTSPSVTFKSGTLYGSGTITVATDVAGGYTVSVYSNVAGDHTITVTAGSASKTEVVTFAAATDAEGATLTLAAPTSVAPGQTLVIVATLKDKYGNPVNTDAGNLALTYTGPGLIVGALADETGVAGTATVRVLLGSGDSGSASLTASYAGADGFFSTESGKTAANDVDNLSAAASVVIGTAGNTGAYKSWTSNQNDGTVKMYAKNVVGAGKVQFMLNGVEIAWVRAASTADSKLRLAGAEGAAYLVRTVDLVEGQKNILEIYVDGVRTTRTAYTY